MARFREKGEALCVPLEKTLDLDVSGDSHVNLLLVFEETLLVLLIDSRGRWSVEVSAVLVAQLSILVLLGLERLLADVEHICVHRLHILRASDG